MKRIFWLPTGRDIWFDIADQLEQAGVATPVLWIGDDALYKRAKQRFPKAEVLTTSSLNNSPRTIPRHKSAPFSLELVLGPEWTLIRDHALKLMDRSDFKGDFLLLERDGFFYQLASWAKSTLDRLKPDLVFTSESPHSPATYVLFAMANALGIRAVSGVLIPLMPAMYFCEGLSGPIIKIKKYPDIAVSFRKYIQSELYGYKNRVLNSLNYAPDYVTQLTNMPLLRSSVYTIKGLTGKRRAGFATRNRLKMALSNIEAAIPTGEYVYFPLHYEPERTTTPDGGFFYDQIKTILTLRAIIPKHVSIVVKEHPSMFSIKNFGHLGRHPRHYSVLGSLSGVTIVPIETNSLELIANATAIATITGTVAIEAALLGKSSIVFGSPWYKGLPNTIDFVMLESWLDLVGCEPLSAELVIEWLVDKIGSYGVYGTPNPSGMKAFPKEYSDPSFLKLEQHSLFYALRGIITGLQK